MLEAAAPERERERRWEWKKRDVGRDIERWMAVGQSDRLAGNRQIENQRGGEESESDVFGRQQGGKMTAKGRKLSQETDLREG